MYIYIYIYIYMKSESEVAQLCPTLCDPMDCNLPGSSVHGVFQARILEWVAISFSRGSSPPRDWNRVSRIVGRRLIVWATREVHIYIYKLFTLQYCRDQHNIVDQLYSNKNWKKRERERENKKRQVMSWQPVMSAALHPKATLAEAFLKLGPQLILFSY